MRRAAVMLAALLGACQVQTDGARCDSDSNCPSGQACGNDRTCSERAAACAATRCTPGATRCGTQGAVERCTDADKTCGTWTAEPCAAGLSCGALSGAHACECLPAEGGILVADPAAGSALPYATGRDSPAQCRFARLGDALAAATPGTTVRAAGAPPGGTVAFSKSAGETLPLTIPAGVTLTSDAATGGGRYVVRMDDPAAPAAIRLQSSATLSAVDVENVAVGETGVALVLDCATSDPIHLDSVALDGRGNGAQLGSGLVVDGQCGVVATGVDIAGMKSDGVAIRAATGGVANTFTGGSVTACGRGVYLKTGALRLDGVRVQGNAGFGVEAGALTGDSALELVGARVLGNGDSGVVLLNNRELVVSGTTVFGNAAVTVWGGASTPSGVSRLAGGIVLRGPPPQPGTGGAVTFQFERNRVYANKGDQVLVLGSSSEWHLTGLGCGYATDGSPKFNVFACYDASAQPSGVTGRGLVVVDASADASSIAWQNVTPTADFMNYGTGATIDVGNNLFCAPDPKLDCASPDPKP